MCTLVALHRVTPGVPLVVAANRDEFYARPAEGPALRRTRAGAIVAPLDVEAGGTWIGVNGSGLIAAVTNVAGGSRDPERRSRGRLVLDALECASAREAAERAASVETGNYNPFNLFVADRERAFAVTGAETPRRIDFGAGVFVIGNAPLDAPPTPKVRRLQRRAERLGGRPLPELLPALAELCRRHEPGGDALHSACVHTDRYGTRSSILLALAERERESAFRFADGAPCETEYEDFTSLLHELGRGPRRVGGARVEGNVS